ncbi:MAG: SO_0444 family Cu/Zn efflux transporter [Candidatus Eisenbacteria bacterium]|nr:SO_0444 family Cu/Zn efflux transporter [Candidatus Eisenbacteria bacterium]
MTLLIGFFRDFVLETVRMLYESGLFLLFGFFVAGLLHSYLSTERIVTYLGKRGFRSMVNAAILGAPLPLCSCGVLPAAVELRKKGASRESVLSFLITTPETSFESIVLSYGLLGPVYAVARPIVAIVTALVAGAAHMIFGEDGDADPLQGRGAKETEPAPTCAAEVNELDELKIEEYRADSRYGRFRAASHYAFSYLFDELLFWFMLGIVLTGLLGALLPPEFFGRYLGSGVFSILVAVAVGIPLYMCASGSTPIAAAFLAKGLNPGAVLAFLLTGPVTNAVSISVLGKVFGRRFLKILIASIMAVSIVAGLLFNRVYTWSASHVPGTSGSSTGFLLSAAKGIGLVVFLYLAYRSFRRTGVRHGWCELKDNMRSILGPIRRFRPRHLYGTTAGRVALAAAAAVYLLTGFYTVRPGEVGMERVFGVIRATDRAPGLHWCPPRPFGRSARCSVDGVVRLDIGFRSEERVCDPLDFYCTICSEPGRAVNRIFEEALFLTGDENIVDVISTVHYRVSDPIRYTFGVEAAEQLIRDVALWSILRETAAWEIDRIITDSRYEIERRVEERANAVLDEGLSGLRIEEIRLQATHAPREVHYDFRDVASAQEDRARMIHEAYVYWEGAVNGARGQAARIVADAEAAHSERVASARGAAAKFLALQEASAEEPGSIRLRLYLETMERILPGCRTVIRPDPGAVDDFEIWFRSGKGNVLPDLFGAKREGTDER